jgi:hypothetical protein
VSTELTQEDSIEPYGAGTFIVYARRVCSGQSVSEQVIVRHSGEVDPERLPHIQLAASRAWLRLGQRLLGQRDADGAVTCARGGLEELGKDYGAKSKEGVTLSDDSDTRIRSAETIIAAGRASVGAETLLGVLSLRISIYTRQRQATLAEKKS